MDALFDLPVPASEIAANATPRRIASSRFLIASERDLLRLKRMAMAGRAAPGDAEDVAFLESRTR